MPHRQFSERLNKELDVLGLPVRHQERVDAFARLLHIQKVKAAACLEGAFMPDASLLHKLAEELDVNAGWLMGKDNATRHGHEDE